LLLAGFLSLVSSTGCALYNLEFACLDDTECAFGRVCSVDGRCLLPGDIDNDDNDNNNGEGEIIGDAEGEPPPEENGEGEANNGGEGEPDDECEVIVAPATGLVLNGAAIGAAASPCVVVQGTVVLAAARQNLLGLGKVVQITGALSIENSEIVSFAGAEELVTVGSISIRENGDLTNLAGFGSLDRVIGELRLRDNPGFTDADASNFAARFSVGSLDIRDNGIDDGD
jgi:hypothetical protein